MRTYDIDDKKDLKKLKAEPWMVKALKMNPEYPFWGPEEDYMGGGSKYNEETKQCESKGSGWGSNLYFNDWKDFEITLDDLNEVVNFYFEVNRDSENCEHCGQTGLNPETKLLEEQWYGFTLDGGYKEIEGKWCDKITQDEVDALWAEGRLKFDFDKKPTAAQVNEWQRGKGMGHDAINRWICVKQRAKRLGVYGQCEYCDGNGYTYTAPQAHVELVLWLLHPRKGASRGVRIRNIAKEDFNEAVEFLKGARKRNNDRFRRIRSLNV